MCQTWPGRKWRLARGIEEILRTSISLTKTPAEFAATLNAKVVRYARMVTESGAKAE